MSGNKNPGPVPNRWLHCPRKSTGLIANKFLAFKTPLSSLYDQVPQECIFTPQMLLQTKIYKGRIGLWINLTNTTRFYNENEIKKENIKYVKLQCRGHDGAPSVEQANVFVSLVDKFISENPQKIIAVHCTHGFNRTGFLIVSYLVEKMDCSLESALAQFTKLRPPGIYKGDYLEELYRRYDDIDDVPPPPELPDWCQEYDDTEDTEASGKHDNDRHKKKKEFQNENPVFMEGVPGVKVFKEQPKLFDLQRKIQSMCGWKGKGFPGSQPVSMNTKNIYLLNKKPYRVSWKADGTRYMMLILKENEVYFFDRDNSVFKVEGIKFPFRKDQRHLVDTLLDGEMVIDKVNGTAIPRYLVYDIIRFEGQEVYKSPFYPTRLQCIQNEIIQPRHVAIRERRINKNNEPFSIRHKEFWDVTQAANLLGDKFSKMLSHEPDGLIFQPSKEPYVPGTCEEVLKWKPLVLNTVDFKLKIEVEGGKGIVTHKVGNLYVGQLNRPLAQMKVSKAIKKLDNKIIECKLENNQWTFLRERVDKSFPNSYNTALAVCNSIQDPVTKEGLLDFIQKKRFCDDQDIMPPPPKMPRRH